MGKKKNNSYFYRKELWNNIKPELKFEVLLNKEDKIRKMDIERLTPPSVLINPEEKLVTGRSEERRVGKERMIGCSYRWWRVLGLRKMM